jgi:hypothetical protein
MSDIRLYVDEDASEHAVIRGLRARGVDILRGGKGVGSLFRDEGWPPRTKPR